MMRTLLSLMLWLTLGAAAANSAPGVPDPELRRLLKVAIASDNDILVLLVQRGDRQLMLQIR